MFKNRKQRQGETLLGLSRNSNTVTLGKNVNMVINDYLKHRHVGKFCNKGNRSFVTKITIVLKNVMVTLITVVTLVTWVPVRMMVDLVTMVTMLTLMTKVTVVTK